MKNMKTVKKSMRVLITILISLVCINGALFIATLIATAAVTPAAAAEEANAVNKVAATKVSDQMTASFEARLEKQKQLKSVTANVAKKTTAAPIVKTTTKRTATVAKTSTAAKTTATKSTTSTAAKTTSTTTVKATATSTSTTSSTSGISTLRGSVNRSLMSAFDQLKFVIKINPNSTYLGYFSTSRHSLEMRSISVSTFRHEMGHFLDVLKNMPSRSSEFASIFSKEKSKYTGTNGAYITKNAQEYFAQSYRNYLENSGKLKAERPLTYAFVQKQISNISSTDITRTYNKYSWSW